MMMQSAKKADTSSSDSSSNSNSNSSSDSSSSNSGSRRHCKQAKRAAAPEQSVAAARAIGRVLNAACTDAAYLAVVLCPTLTLQLSARLVLGARGRKALLDAHKHINRARQLAQAPPVQQCELHAIHNRAQERLCKRIRLAARAAAAWLPNADVAVAVANAASSSYVECTFDPESSSSVSPKADLVRECLYAICADADRPCCNPLQWRECLPYFILHSEAPALVAYLADWAVPAHRLDSQVKTARRPVTRRRGPSDLTARPGPRTSLARAAARSRVRSLRQKLITNEVWRHLILSCLTPYFTVCTTVRTATLLTTQEVSHDKQ
jgi:hypothetical protein